MCKKLKLNHTTKWYTHKPESVLENEVHKILWDFEIQTDHLIPARRPDLVVINKKQKTCRLVDFSVLADHKVKSKESEKKDKYLDLAREQKTLWNIGVTVKPIVIGMLRTLLESLEKGLKELEIEG